MAVRRSACRMPPTPGRTRAPEMTARAETSGEAERAPSTPLVAIRNLNVEFRTDDGVHPVVRDVSFDVGAGKCLGLVGESGSGKSVTALAIMGLLPPAPH